MRVEITFRWSNILGILRSNLYIGHTGGVFLVQHKTGAMEFIEETLLRKSKCKVHVNIIEFLNRPLLFALYYSASDMGPLAFQVVIHSSRVMMVVNSPVLIILILLILLILLYSLTCEHFISSTSQLRTPQYSSIKQGGQAPSVASHPPSISTPSTSHSSQATNLSNYHVSPPE